MTLQNTTTAQDKVLSQCEEFGGLAFEAAQVAEYLDGQIRSLEDKIAQYENQIGELEYEIEQLKERIE